MVEFKTEVLSLNLFKRQKQTKYGPNIKWGNIENGKQAQKIESIKQDDRSKTKHISYDNVCKCVNSLIKRQRLLDWSRNKIQQYAVYKR